MMYTIDYDKQREYATQNNWILPLAGEVYYTDDPKRSVTDVKLKLDISVAPAPVFEEMNKEFWKAHFAKFGDIQLKSHLMDLGYYPGKNRGALVSKLCIHYRRVVGA